MKKPTVPSGIRDTTSGGGPTASQRSSGHLVSKRKANELVSSGYSSESSIGRPAPGTGSAPLPANSTETTSELAGRQLVSSEGWMTYAAVVTAPVALHLPSGPLTPTAKDSDPSEPAVSSEPAPGACLATCPGQ
jgi:hypothetical protein